MNKSKYDFYKDAQSCKFRLTLLSHIVIPKVNNVDH